MNTDFAEVPAATELLIWAGLKALFGQSENQHAWEGESAGVVAYGG